MAAVQEFLVKVTTTGLNNLDKLADKADMVGSRINALNTAILGVGFGAFINGALQSADRISDLSDATGLSIGRILAFEKALDAAGGKARNAERILTGFYASIENAAQGSMDARDAFAKVGVTLDDLRNLSEQDLLSKTLEGLSKMQAGSERTAIATQLLTRAFRSVAPEVFAAAMASGDFAQLEESVKRSAAQAQQLEEAYKNLQLGALEAISPILSLMGEHNLSVAAAQKLITALGAALAITFAAKTISAAASFIKLMRDWNVLTKVQVGLQAALQALQGPKGWAILAGSAAAAGVAIYGLNKLLDENAAKAGNVGAGGVGASTGGGAAGRTVTPGAARTLATDPRQRAAMESQKRIQESALAEQLALAQRGADELKRIELERDADIARARLEIMSKENLSKTQKEAEFLAKKKEITAKSELDISDLRKREEEKRAEEAKQQLEKITRAREQAAGVVGDAQRANEQQQQRFNLEQRLLGLREVDRQYQQELFALGQEQLNQLQAIRAIKDLPEEDRIAREREITAEYEKQKAALEGQRQARIATQNDPRAGAASVIAQMEDATTPFKVAADQTSALFNGMNSALDNFVRTGKFKFKDFARSVILDLVAIQAKAAATAILSSVLKSFGLNVGAGTVPGRAIGGPVSANSPYIVGEKGPELFVPRSNGNIVPNGQLGVMGNNSATSVVYNIQAVDAMSFRQMLARDPEFLYSLTEQTRKSLPARRRQ